MTTNAKDANTALFEQAYFELDKKGFTAFENMLDDPLARKSRARRTLHATAPWEAPGAQISKAKHDDRAAS